MQWKEYEAIERKKNKKRIVWWRNIEVVSIQYGEAPIALAHPIRLKQFDRTENLAMCVETMRKNFSSSIAFVVSWISLVVAIVCFNSAVCKFNSVGLYLSLCVCAVRCAPFACTACLYVTHVHMYVANAPMEVAIHKILYIHNNALSHTHTDRDWPVQLLKAL